MSPPLAGAAPSRLPPWLLRATAVLGVFFLTVLMFSPAEEVMDIPLDSSNYGSYSYFTAKDFQYGPEVVPMAGPYGFVHYGFTYGGQLFWKRLGLEIFTKLVLSVLLVWFFQQSPDRPRLRWCWLLLIAVVVPPITDVPYEFAILLSGLCLIRYHLTPGRRGLAACCGVAAYVALLTLFKGTQAMLGLATVGLLGLQALVARNFRRLPWIVAAYFTALLALLFIAGQNPLNFPMYLRGLLELSSGYNAAMGLDEPRAVFLSGGGALLALEALLLLCLLPRWRNPVALAGGLYFAGFTFISWKHGFVRADGHVLIFFQYVCVAAPMILLFFAAIPVTGLPRWQRLLAGALACTALSLGIWADGNFTWLRHETTLRDLPARIGRAWAQIAAPATAKAALDARLAVQHGYYQIPRLRRVVEDRPIDFFGNEEGYLMLNRFNYRPRPMGGGTFNVFTPWLHDRNVAFMLDPARRPDFFLVNLQTIDDRFAAQDDAGTLRALLANYSPVETGSGLTLFQANAGPPRLPAPTLLGTQPLAWDTPVTVPAVGPNEMVLVSFSLPLNFAGRLRAALYKPPLVFMDLAGQNIVRPIGRKIIPSMFRSPVPLSPVFENTDDLLGLYLREPGKIVTGFRLQTAGAKYFAPTGMTVNFYRASRPDPAPVASVRLVNSLVTKVEPFLVEALAAPILRLDNFVAQILIPPARMGFMLSGDEKQVAFSYGMTPETYSRPTDGVDVFVDLERPNLPTQEIFHRNLSPRFRPADRGKQSALVGLPPFPPGSKLFLRVGRGPANDGEWDLAYVTEIKFGHGPYLPDQFPGFATVPIAVEAAMCGRLTDHGRDIFMLHAPGSVTFRLTGREKNLVFSGGMLPGAYTGDGWSDGVEFQVDLNLADGSGPRLLNYYYNPRDNPADRVDHVFEVPLPPTPAGTTLTLRATAGPRGNAAWDWSYLTGVRLE